MSNTEKCSGAGKNVTAVFALDNSVGVLLVK